MSLPKPYYQDGACTIYLGDCREILSELPKVDLVLTDPPYGEVNRASGGLRGLDKGAADNITGGELDALLSVSAKTFYVWCGIEQVSQLRRGFVAAGFTTRLGIWSKSNPSPMNGERLWLSGLECCVFARAEKATFNRHCKKPIWEGPTESETDHPTEKPIWLFKELMDASSNPGDLILDPYMGSGTTLRAAKDLGRKAIGIESDEEKYCEIAVKRLRQEVLL